MGCVRVGVNEWVGVGGCSQVSGLWCVVVVGRSVLSVGVSESVGGCVGRSVGGCVGMSVSRRVGVGWVG